MRPRISRASALLVAAWLGLGCAGCNLDPGRVDQIVEAPDAHALVVDTASGPVAGVASAAGEAFLGIPYAAPPIGANRWRAPLPPVPWTEPRPATTLGPTCLQNLSLAAQTGDRGSGPLLGDEDCLTLNVYAPAGTRSADKRPVMVWIHGGAYVLGSGGQYDPSRLAAAAGAVIVTFNYRLGALGFLAHPALRGAAGNGAFALLDQQAALRWVHRNIASFGGDPQAVTLFGQSAGAWSACAQLASPGAVGLFARVILESGPCMTPQTSLASEAAEAGGTRLAANLGCNAAADPIDCLRAKSAVEIAAASPERDGVTGPQSWAPMTGGDVLPLPPAEAFARGRFVKVPVVDGTNRDEGRLFAYLRGYRADLWTEANYRDVMSRFFGAKAPAVLARYPASASSPGQAYAAALTDALFACAALTLDRTLSRFVPVYAYEFDDPSAPFALPAMPWLGGMKAFHTAEIAYVFGTPWALADPADFDPAQRRLSAEIQAYWGRFARDGDPGGGAEPAWPRFSRGEAIETLAPAGITPTPDFASRHDCGFWASLGY